MDSTTKSVGHRSMFATGSADSDAVTRYLNDNSSHESTGKNEEELALEYRKDIEVRKNCPAPGLIHMHPAIIDTARACKIVQVEKNADEHTKGLQLCREVREILIQCHVFEILQLPLHLVTPSIEVYQRVWAADEIVTLERIKISITRAEESIAKLASQIVNDEIEQELLMVL